MHIILVVHQFGEGRIGGTERYTLNLARGLVEYGHRVTVLTFAEDDSAQVHLVASEIVGFPTLTVVASLLHLDDPVRASYAGDLFKDVLVHVLDEAQPDIVHITHPGNLGLGLIDLCHEKHIPVVATLTDYWAICPTSQLLRINGDVCPGPVDVGQCARCITNMGPRGTQLRGLTERLPAWGWRFMLWLSHNRVLTGRGPLRWLSSLRERQDYICGQLDKAGVVFCPGAFQREMLVANGMNAQQLVHAPHGIVDPEGIMRERTASETLRCAYIGPLAEHKGAMLPLLALAQLAPRTDIRLDYWGSIARTPYAQDVQRAIAADDRVQHRGSFKYAQIGDVLAGVDVLIMPSIWYENTPTILYEAFAAGVPVITSDLGGMCELVQAYAGGWLFPAGDVSALARRMAQLADDPDAVAHMSMGMRPVPDFASHLQLVLEAYHTVTGR